MRIKLTAAKTFNTSLSGAKESLMKIVQPKTWDELYNLFWERDTDIETYIMSCIMSKAVVDGGIGSSEIDEGIFRKNTQESPYIYICQRKYAPEFAKALEVSKSFFVLRAPEGIDSDPKTCKLLGQGAFAEMYKLFLTAKS